MLGQQLGAGEASWGRLGLRQKIRRSLEFSGDWASEARRETGPPVVPFYLFWGGFPYYRKRDTLILTSLPEDLVKQSHSHAWRTLPEAATWIP